MLKSFVWNKAVLAESRVRGSQMMEELEERRFMSVTLSSVAVAGTEGKLVKGPVATFVSSDPTPQRAGNYTATINWGDGQTTTARVKADRAHPGQFDVIGGHRYAEAGTFSTTVSVHDAVDSSDGSTTGSATMSDAPLRGSRKHGTTTVGTAFDKTVAIFKDANPLSVASDFTATIDWGDGSTSSGTVAANGHGTFRVLGSHTYAATGRFAVTVTITDAEGSSVTVISDARVRAVKAKK